jgi:hypothetical protein
MKARALLAFGLACVTLKAQPSAAAECVIYRNNVQFDADQIVRMMVSSGTDCRVQFPLRDRIVIDVNEITAHPLYGGVRVYGTSGAYYRSNPGYRGPDAFAFAFCRQEGEKSACANIHVKVEVR